MVDDRWQRMLAERVPRTGLELIGEIPRDAVLVEAVWRGEPLTSLGSSAAKDMIAVVMERIESPSRVAAKAA